MNGKLSYTIIAALILLFYSCYLYADIDKDLLLAKEYMQQSRYTQANYYYFKVLDVDQSNIVAQYGIAKSFLEQRNLTQAKIELDKLLRMDSSHLEGLLLGVSIENLNQDWKSALQYAEQAAKVYPENPEVWFYLSSVLAGIGDRDAAEDAMSRYRTLSNKTNN